MNLSTPSFTTVPVLSHEQCASDVWRLTVSTVSDGDPGQFYLLRCWDRDPLLSRPISIHDVGPGTLRFLYQVRGKGTGLLAHLKPGDDLTLTGPLGNGFRIADLHGRVAVVTGGIGIAPALHLVRSLAGCQVTVIAGFRQEVYALSQFPLYGAAVAVATEDGCDGARGFCTEIFDPHVYDAVATCGPMPMMARVAQLCAEAGVPCQASLEAHMACGMGACLVCSCATIKGNKRVCADGPVFDATEVIWHA
jgi:dihydroorotate dehydrogenase electron transfer subunit